jgi:SAM-dependent methyltransferase
MAPWTFLKIALAYTVGAYVVDVVAKPSVIAARARAAADARGKPLLNVGCGMPGSSLRVALLGPTGWGNVNCDLAAPSECSSDGAACHCDAQALPFPDKFFGAAIASHVLEHVADPNAAIRELHRVADEVFVITPAWWAPHTYLHPGHRWLVTPSGRYLPLWDEAAEAHGPELPAASATVT